jgi:hypothetical protein
MDLQRFYRKIYMSMIVNESRLELKCHFQSNKSLFGQNRGRLFPWRVIRLLYCSSIILMLHTLLKMYFLKYLSPAPLPVSL